MTDSIGEIEAAIRPLDLRLEPIASQRVDINAPGGIRKVVWLDPLGQAAIRRDEAENLLLRIIGCYADAGAEDRQRCHEPSSKI